MGRGTKPSQRSSLSKAFFQKTQGTHPRCDLWRDAQKKKRSPQQNEIEQLNLSAIFETEDENEEFLGFDVTEITEQNSSQELKEIFSTTGDEEEFIGFEIMSTGSDPES